MSDDAPEKNWKLKLRYGKLKTPHLTLIADGIVTAKLMEGFSCRPGRAFMAMKVWASSNEEAFDMAQSIGKQIGFIVTGRIELFTTEPTAPPRANSHGYDIQFTPYDPEDRPAEPADRAVH